jgi:hypothetical protein
VTNLVDGQRIAPSFFRLLHDRTADKIAGVVSRIPGASAQIVAYDIASRITQATRVGGAPPARPSVADNRIDLPESQPAYAK